MNNRKEAKLSEFYVKNNKIEQRERKFNGSTDE